MLNIQNLIYGYEKISSTCSPSPVDTLFFIQKAYVTLISGKFCLFTKACSHFSEENTETILVSQVIQNYVGLISSLRIRRSKSIAFVGCPTIFVILTLRSCDMLRQIMVIPHTFSPFRHNRVRWHAETNYGHSVPFCHPEPIVPDDMRKQIMVIPPSRHSRVRWHVEANYGHSAPFCHPKAASPMTCGDKLWSFRTFCHPDTIVSDGTQRQIMVILRPFVIQRRSCSMTCGDKLWSFRTPFRHPDTVVSDGTQRQIMVIMRPFVIQRRSCPMTCEDKLWSSARFCYL